MEKIEDDYNSDFFSLSWENEYSWDENESEWVLEGKFQNLIL